MFGKKQPKTALVLSGGGSRGSYQVGVWKALRERGIKIDIVTGTSVGAINGAMVALGDYNNAERLWNSVKTEDVFDLNNNFSNQLKSSDRVLGLARDEAYGFAHAILSNGGATSNGMYHLLNRYIDENKLRKSPISYGLVTTSVPSLSPVKLFKEDIPPGLLHKFIQASASCFPAAQICDIDENKYIDGGCVDNLPVDMALSKGAERIIAVDLQAIGVIKKDVLQKVKDTTDFFHIHSHFDLGNFLSFDPQVAQINMRYGYLDGLKAFGNLDGRIFAFKTGEFSSQDLISADSAAYVFDAEKTTIYSEKILSDELKLKVLDAQIALHKNPLHLVSPPGIPTPSAISNMLSELGKKIEPSALAVYVAEDFQKHGSSSIFHHNMIATLIPREIAAAEYLLKKNLLQN